MTDKDRSSISDVLRNTVIASGAPYLRIEQATGVPRASISRFVARKRSLRLDMADRLAAFFGLALTVCVPDKGERAGYER
jgi:plasmid maintenance system antidote protein VapI